MKQSMRRFKRGKKWARFLYIFVIFAYIISYIFFVKSIISLSVGLGLSKRIENQTKKVYHINNYMSIKNYWKIPWQKK